MRELASEAVTTPRELLTSLGAPPAVRHRTALVILESTNAMEAESIGLTSAVVIRSTMRRQELLNSLGD